MKFYFFSDGQYFGRDREDMTCPNCSNDIKTMTKTKRGNCVMLSSIMSLIFPCMALVCCLPSCHDVVHQCPDCKMVLGKYLHGYWNGPIDDPSIEEESSHTSCNPCGMCWGYSITPYKPDSCSANWFLGQDYVPSQHWSNEYNAPPCYLEPSKLEAIINKWPYGDSSRFDGMESRL